MGCLCSSSMNRHDTEWELSSVTRDRVSGALQRAMQRPPKWTLSQVTPAGDTVEMFSGVRRTRMGWEDHVTLRVCYDHPLQNHVTIVAASQCGNPNHNYDWGQNKRNLAQLRKELDKELFSVQAHPLMADASAAAAPLEESLMSSASDPCSSAEP